MTGPTDGPQPPRAAGMPWIMMGVALVLGVAEPLWLHVTFLSLIAAAGVTLVESIRAIAASRGGRSPRIHVLRIAAFIGAVSLSIGVRRADFAWAVRRAEAIGRAAERFRVANGRYPAGRGELPAASDPGPFGPLGRRTLDFYPPDEQHPEASARVSWHEFMLTSCDYSLRTGRTVCDD